MISDANYRKEHTRRIREGMKRARARGVRFGRPKRVIPWKKIENVCAKGLSIRSALKLLDIPESSFYRAKREIRALDGNSCNTDLG